MDKKKIEDRIVEGNVFDGTREDLARLFAELGYTKGAEIGVSAGAYSLCLCRSIPNLELFCVDPWKVERYGNARKMEVYYQRCLARLPPYGAKLMRMTSVEAAKLIPDDSLDFVYIDALHDYDNVKMDIELWAPKVRMGGIVSGHDYVELHYFGVIQAVDEYTKANNIVFYTTRPEYLRDFVVPSWFWEVK
jgi:predicted O-methyltransferase YrrM